MSAFFNKKWLIRGVLWLLLIPALVLVRHRSGSHYLPVAVEFTKELLRYGNDIQVHVISPFGTSRLLTRDAYDRLVFRSPDYFGGAVQYITVSGVKPGFIDNVKLRVILGTSGLGLARSCPVTVRPSAIEAVSKVVKDPIAVYGAENGPLSVLVTPAKCLNWQGDIVMILLCSIQAALLTLLLNILGEFLRRGLARDFGSEASQRIVDRAVCVVGNRTVHSILIFVPMLVIGHQFWVQLWQLFLLPDANDQIAGLVAVASVVFTVWRCRDGLGDAPRSISILVASLLACLLLGVRWFVSGRLPWSQTSDYLSYWTNGGLMADGNWQDINRTHLGWILAIRSFVFAYPVRSLAGNSITILAVLNSCILLVAALLLYWRVKRSFGLGAGLVSALMFSLHPDVLFGGHLCRHDTPFLLMFMCVAAVMDKVLAMFHSESVSLRDLVYACVLVLFGGVMTGLIEAQRGYMPFVLVAVLVCFVLTVFTNARNAGWHQSMRGSRLRLGLQLGVLFFVLSVSAIITSQGINMALLAKAGALERRSIAEMLVSFETGTPQDWVELQTFAGCYAGEIPRGVSTDFLVRKLLLEKVRSGVAFWIGLVDKNATISGLRHTIGLSGGVGESDFIPSVFNLPFASLKMAWGGGWYCVMLSCALVRILLIRRIPFVVLEVFPSVFGLVAVVVILGLTEANEGYDVFLAVPLAIATAVVFSAPGGFPDERRKGPFGRRDSGLCELRYFAIVCLRFVCVLVCCVGVHELGAIMLDCFPRWTFVQPAEIDTNDTVGVSECGRFSCAVFPEPGKSLSSGVVARASFLVEGKDLSRDELRFFVSRDQRRQRNRGFSGDFDVSLSFGVLIDGKVASEGVLRDLRVAKFVQHPLLRKAGSHEIELVMTATRAISAEEVSSLPRLAVEYVH